jgi:hypothetical protein
LASPVAGALRMQTVAAQGAKNEPRPGIRAAEAKDQVSGVRAGRHENPHSILLNA